MQSGARSPPLVAAEFDRLGVDCLVHNAGSAGPDLPDECESKEQADVLRPMRTSVARICHLLIPGMRERGLGRILNVVSVADRTPRTGNLKYGPSKAYVAALSKVPDLALRSGRVRACELSPGFNHTEFHAAAGPLEEKAALPGFVWYDAEVMVGEGWPRSSAEDRPRLGVPLPVDRSGT